MASRITSMEQFRKEKRAFQQKWGEKMITGTAAEMEEMTKESAELARFAKLRPEKFLWALSQDWQACNKPTRKG